MKETTLRTPSGLRDLLRFAFIVLAGVVVVLLVMHASIGIVMGGMLGILLLYSILKRPEIGLMLVAASIPLGNYSPISAFYGTLTSARFFALITAGVVALHFTVGRHFGEIPRSSKNFTLFLLSLFVLLSALTGISIPDSVTGLFYYYSSFLICFLVLFLVRDEKTLAAVVLAVVLPITAFLLLGILSFQFNLGFAARFSMGENTRRMTSSSFLGPNSFALMLVSIFPFAFSYYVHERNWRLRLIYIIWAGLIVFGTLITFSRASTVTLGLVTVYILVRSYRRLSRREIMGFAAVTVVVLALLPGMVCDRVESLSRGTDDPSLKSRWAYILVGAEIVKDHPLLGVGPNNYKLAYASPEYRSVGYLSESNAEIGKERGRVGRAAHNMYVEMVSEIGLPGLAMMLFVFFCTWREYREARSAFRRLNDEKMSLLTGCLEIGFLAFLLNSFFLSSEFFPILWVFVGTSGACLALSRKKDKWPVVLKT